MKITVYQDTICPWCYVGKEFLNEALESWNGDVELEYRSYFLNPNLPDEGLEGSDKYLEEKYGKEAAEQMQENLRRIGKEAGIEFNFEDNKKIPNTKKSHQLLKMFPDHQEILLSAIFEAYFIDARDIGSVDVLVDSVENVGLPIEGVRQKLENNELLNEVMEDYQRGMNIGVRGVPFFVFNDETAIYGAHKPETILQTMKRSKDRESVHLELT